MTAEHVALAEHAGQLLDAPVALEPFADGWWVVCGGATVDVLAVDRDTGRLLAFPPGVPRHRVAANYRRLRKRAVVLGQLPGWSLT